MLRYGGAEVWRWGCRALSSAILPARSADICGLAGQSKSEMCNVFWRGDIGRPSGLHLQMCLGATRMSSGACGRAWRVTRMSSREMMW